MKTRKIATHQQYSGGLPCPFPNKGVHDRTTLISAVRFCLEPDPDMFVIVRDFHSDVNGQKAGGEIPSEQCGPQPTPAIADDDIPF